MAAYWINTFTSITDEERLQAYAALAGDVMRTHGGTFLARGNPTYAFEEATLLRTTVIEFPTVEHARAAYESDAYQEALRVLGDGATREIRVIDGV